MKKQFIEIKNERICYLEEENDKHAYLFLHGYNHSALEFTTPFINNSQERKYRIIALDLPGHGESSSNEQLSIEHMSEVVEEFIEKLNLKKLTIVAMCMGGLIAAKVAAHKNVEKIVLIGSYVPYMNMDKKQVLKWLKPSTVEEAKNSILTMLWNKEIAMPNIDVMGQHLLEKVKKTGKRNDFLLGQLTSNEFCKDYGLKAFSNHSKDTMLIASKQDPLCPVTGAKKTAEKFKNIDLKLLDNCGHAALWEKTDDLVKLINQ